MVTEAIPVAEDQDGVIRVSGTRVTLESIMGAFSEGATAEEIAQQYPSVPLSGIYQVIGHYLRHEAELQIYLNRRRSEEERVRKENEARCNPQDIRGRLMARHARRP